jgi:hypothetical protein
MRCWGLAMSERRVCPNCGEVLPARSPRELCLRCLLRAGMRSDANIVSRQGRHAASPGGTDARAVLAELCAAYRYPIYALARRLGRGESDALDLTQEYVVRIVAKPVLGAAERAQGRFREKSAAALASTETGRAGYSVDMP